MSKKVCRVCFKADSQVYNLFQLAAIDSEGNEIPVHKMLTFCCSIEISLQLPMDICTKCVEAATNAYNFIKQFHKSNDLLLKHFKPKTVSEQVPESAAKRKRDSDCDSILISDDDSIEEINSDENNERNVEEVIIIDAKTVVDENEIKLVDRIKPKIIKKRKRNRYIKQSQMCSYCGKIYKGGLRYHEEQHTNEPKYECDICHETFIAKDKFRYHRIKIHNIGSHLCSVCGQIFHNKTQLRDHSWIHTGIKSYKCEVCGQRFSSPNSLKKHRIKKLCGKRKVYRAAPRSEDRLIEQLK